MYLLASTANNSFNSFPLYKVFAFWLNTLGKLFNLLKRIEIFPHVSLFETMVAFFIISILVSIIKFGMRSQNLIRWYDNTLTYWNKDNPSGYKNFGKPYSSKGGVRK